MMYNFSMNSIKKLSFVYLSTIFVLGLWAAVHYRVEMVDGSQALFHMMNNSPYLHYINHRTLSQYIQLSALFTSSMIDAEFSFKTIYLFHNIAIALTPFLIALVTTLFLFKQKQQKLLVYYFISFSLSVLITYSFHISLVPETLLFGWLAFFCWQYSNSIWSYILGIPCAVLLNLGYESSCGFSVFIIFGTLYLLKEKKLFKEPIASYLLKIVMSILCVITIFYRINKFEHFGVLKYSAKHSFDGNYPMFYSLIASVVLLILLHLKRMNKVLVISLLIVFNIGIYFFTRDSVNLFLSGYHLRVYAFVPSMIILMMMFFNQKNILPNLKYFIAFCYISLLSSAFNDINVTNSWIDYRSKREEELAAYSKGCYILDKVNWEIAYYSINMQQTFKPQYFVIDNTDSTRCNISQGPFQLVPQIYLFDKVRNYNFDYKLFLSE